ncbi:MAG TPA: alpha/beta hydrolase [Acidimicrobiales bacterium]|nr:alpha/beta hydrolase [Acidimicrobiales bacterium]
MTDAVGTTRTGYVTSGGERLYFEVTGQGSPLVLCHGLGGNHASWFQQVPAFAPTHRVITWDQRGFGNSTRSTGVFGPASAVADLVAILDELSVERAHVLGQSMGGWTALGTAIEHPERLTSLVLTDTPAGVRSPEIDVALRDAARAASAGWASDGTGAHPALSDRFTTEHPEAAFLYRELSSFGNKPDDKEMFERMGATHVMPEELADLHLPVLLVVGEVDRLCPPAAVEALRGLIAGAQLQVVAGAGHSPYFETPEAFNRAVLDFLGRVDA